MKTITRTIAVVLLLWVLTVSSALALTFGYDIEINNQLAVTATIEISQYHAEGFDGTRPKAFTENLRLSTRHFQVPPGKSIKVHYNDASGGFWLLWKRIEPTDIPAASGIIDLTERARVIKIK